MSRLRRQLYLHQLQADQILVEGILPEAESVEGSMWKWTSHYFVLSILYCILSDELKFHKLKKLI